MDRLDWTAQRMEMGSWGHLEGKYGSNLQLHPPPPPSAPPLPHSPSAAAAAKPLEEQKKEEEKEKRGSKALASARDGGLKHICDTDRPKPFPRWINGRIMHLIISIWRIRHWKGTGLGWVGYTVKTWGSSNKKLDRPVNHRKDATQVFMKIVYTWVDKIHCLWLLSVIYGEAVIVKISQVSRCSCNYRVDGRHQLLDWIALGLRVTWQSQQMLHHTGLAP